MDDQLTDADILKVWQQPQAIRVFVSHRDAIKEDAHDLAKSLEPFGVSCFVAHDSIEASLKWGNQIMLALDSMEIFLAIVSSDFHNSSFTDQEVGYALARQKDICILPVILDNTSLRGFFSEIQGIKGTPWKDEEVLEQLVHAIEKNCNKKRVSSALVSALVNSPKYSETMNRFERLHNFAKELLDSDVDLLIQGFNKNDQLHNCGPLRGGWSKNPSIVDFLRKVTGKSFELKDKQLKSLD